MRSDLDRELHSELNCYAESNYLQATAILLLNYCLFIAAIFGAVVLDSHPLQLLFSTLAGIQISTLFVIAHDCAHGSFFPSKIANAVFGRLTMLPALHNFSLWRQVHNRWHHSAPNIRGLNSWSPLSPREYETARPIRRFRERFYRSLAGFAFYYMIERWLYYKLIPGPSLPIARRQAAWSDFILILLFLAGWLIVCGLLGVNGNDWAFFESIAFGFAIPFLVWNFMMGKTVFLQHTSPMIPWFENEQAISGNLGQLDVTMHIVTPRWYGIISNEIMEHTAHHIHPKVPLYNLKAAQQKLEHRLRDRLPQASLTPLSILDTIRVCKLYDYGEHSWCDFSGNVTAKVQLPG